MSPKLLIQQLIIVESTFKHCGLLFYSGKACLHAIRNRPEQVTLRVVGEYIGLKVMTLNFNKKLSEIKKRCTISNSPSYHYLITLWVFSMRERTLHENCVNTRA